MNDIEGVLEERTAAAAELLHQAIRLEIAAFLCGHVEERLRARPHFFSRVPHIALQQIRLGLDRDAARLAERAEQPVEDLRVFLGASPRSQAEEDSAFARALAPVAELTRETLTVWAFPDDDSPDRAEDTGVDLDAEWRVAFQPSPNLLWAWHRVRRLDTARNQLADAPPGRPLELTFELKLYLPEALPPDVIG